MDKLIQELTDEHKRILALLSEVKVLGINSNAGQRKLLSARDLLLSHINKEDAQYYPALRRAAEHDRELKVLLEYFENNMAVVSKKASTLFAKYAQGGDATDFAGDFKLLYVTLKDRIQTEEDTLFKKFNLVHT